MEPTWDDYLLHCGDADRRRLLNEWRWLVGPGCAPLLVTTLGDMFLAHDDGRISWLDTYEGSVTEVTPDYETLKATMVQPQFFRRWFLPDLIEQLKAHGVVRATDECYSPIVPPVIGGEMEPSNFHAVAPIVHFAFCGQIHQRVKDLPPGTTIKGIDLSWEPTRESPMTVPAFIAVPLRILAIIWASPYTLLGLLIGVVGVCTGGHARIRGRVIEFYGGGVKWLLHRFPHGQFTMAFTLGHTVLGQTDAALDICREHEMVHVRQFERWGPFMGPAYLGCSLVLWLMRRRPYRDNPFERQAYEEGGGE